MLEERLANNWLFVDARVIVLLVEFRFKFCPTFHKFYILYICTLYFKLDTNKLNVSAHRYSGTQVYITISVFPFPIPAASFVYISYSYLVFTLLWYSPDSAAKYTGCFSNLMMPMTGGNFSYIN